VVLLFWIVNTAFPTLLEFIFLSAVCGVDSFGDWFWIFVALNGIFCLFPTMRYAGRRLEREYTNRLHRESIEAIEALGDDMANRTEDTIALVDARTINIDNRSVTIKGNMPKEKEYGKDQSSRRIAGSR
jgi:hypothetical protein